MRKYYILLSLTFLWGGYWLSSIYRPYAYECDLQDFGLADAGNNLVFVPGVYFLILSVRNRPLVSYFKDIVLVWGLYVFIEVLQYSCFVSGTFDWLDITALTIGAVLTFYSTRILHGADLTISNKLTSYK
ncbi:MULTISPECIES: VanZ family protein [Sphingobacterium]|uniref:VanZ family protein n=1 Tax=Sphingobacterium TaxID=28453 RepID=UPI0013D913DE|nr:MULTISPECIES: hypothetical protein [unclassified Sphingobacterium]